MPRLDLNGNPIILVKENRVGVTYEQLALKHKQVYKCAKPGSNELLNKYLYPLFNQNIINSEKSVINGRQNIWFPVDEQNIPLFNIFSESAENEDDNDDLKLKVFKPETFPSKTFLKEQFRTFINHHYNEVLLSEKKFSYLKLLDVDGSEITVDELIDKYFNDIEDCFSKGYTENILLSQDNTNNQDHHHQQQIEEEKNFQKSDQLPNDDKTEIGKKEQEEYSNSNQISQNERIVTSDKEEDYWSRGARIRRNLLE
jgi:hypothetical protein